MFKNKVASLIQDYIRIIYKYTRYIRIPKSCVQNPYSVTTVIFPILSSMITTGTAFRNKFHALNFCRLPGTKHTICCLSCGFLFIHCYPTLPVSYHLSHKLSFILACQCLQGLCKEPRSIALVIKPRLRGEA